MRFKRDSQINIEALEINRSIETINLSSNLIKDDGAQYLSEAINNNQILSNINLANNSISIDGANNLSKALENKTYKIVVILKGNLLLLNRMYEKMGLYMVK